MELYSERFFVVEQMSPRAKLTKTAMSPDMITQVTAGLLLLLLAAVLGVALALVALVCHYRKRRRLEEEPSLAVKRPAAETGSPRRYGGSAFDGPCRWMVVKSSNVPAVLDELGLHNPRPCSWEDGLALLERGLFVSPPIQGWILIVGYELPDIFDDPDRCFHLIRRMSRALGQVQFFGLNRAVNHHGWVRAKDGRIVRAYAWAGETVWDQGTLSKAEADLGINCFSYGEGAEAAALTCGDLLHANTEKVLQLAARWSFDPTTVGGTLASAPQGVAGDSFRSKAL